jgi:RNA polymerase sigma-70 factor (sigma-E family)
VIESRVPSEAPSRADPLRAAFEEHYTRLLRLCLALAGSREVAEDIVQDAFVRVASRIDRLDPSEVGPYLRRVVVNLWRNRLRRVRLERRHADVRTDDPVTTELEERDEMWRALLRLPRRQRACVVLRYYEDLSERDVAAILRCSVGTVKSQTSRGLARLGRELSR